MDGVGAVTDSSARAPAQRPRARSARKRLPKVRPGAPYEVRPSSIHGLGLFATRAIAAETFLGNYEGERTGEDGPHVLWVSYDDGEEVGIDGNTVLRFVNHARPGNAEFRGHELFAITAIAAGSEITCDYGDDW
jgi:SET domain-containing protein